MDDLPRMTMHSILSTQHPGFVPIGVLILAGARERGLAGLARRQRSERGWPKMPEPLRLLVEGLALQPPGKSATVIHRQAAGSAVVDSREIAGYASNLEALSTAPAFRQAIRRKAEPYWHVCGIPEVFHGIDKDRLAIEDRTQRVGSRPRIQL